MSPLGCESERRNGGKVGLGTQEFSTWRCRAGCVGHFLFPGMPNWLRRRAPAECPLNLAVDVLTVDSLMLPYRFTAEGIGQHAPLPEHFCGANRMRHDGDVGPAQGQSTVGRLNLIKQAFHLTAKVAR
jgi:hypothetical protein